VAQSCIQQGINLANNFKKIGQKKPLKPFKYNDKGSIIWKKNKAVVDLPKPKCISKFLPGLYGCLFTSSH
jgi:NADH dehydrogenase